MSGNPLEKILCLLGNSKPRNWKEVKKSKQVKSLKLLSQDYGERNITRILTNMIWIAQTASKVAFAFLELRKWFAPLHMTVLSLRVLVCTTFFIPAVI